MIKKLPTIARSFKARPLPDIGEREMQVLEVLWAIEDADAQTVLQRLPGERISLSTVQTTLERLHRKQLVSREKMSRAFRYRASMNRSQLISGLIRDMADSVAAGDLAPMLSGFIDYVAGASPGLGKELSAALETSESNAPQPLDDKHD